MGEVFDRAARKRKVEFDGQQEDSGRKSAVLDEKKKTFFPISLFPIMK